MSKELQEIFARVKALKSGESAVLATVVDVRGSSYRLPGARMLITGSGESLGTVSGGCLEADVIERARQVMKTGEPQVFVYDTTANEDSVFSLNMGCRGVIRILLERVDDQSNLLKAFEIALENQEPQTIVTLVSTENDLSIPPGGRFFYSQVEQFDFGNLSFFLKEMPALLEDCIIFSSENSPTRIKTYQTGRGNLEFFFENIEPPVSLVIFGAGADAVPLTEIAKNLGWRTLVVDHRRAVATSERFRKADEIVISQPENINNNIRLTERSVAVVMTHNYEKDKEILRRITPLNLAYVGVLGPKHRTESLLRILADEGIHFDQTQLTKLFAPVGLDIGATTPEAIALSIIAEIQAVLSNRAGGFLKNRQGSIYNRNTI